MKHTLTQIVKDTTAKLKYICAGKCYFEIEVEDSLYQLEINSMEEEWTTTYLYPEFKTITLMRWIRKSIDKNDEKFIQLK